MTLNTLKKCNACRGFVASAAYFCPKCGNPRINRDGIANGFSEAEYDTHGYFSWEYLDRAKRQAIENFEESRAKEKAIQQKLSAAADARRVITDLPLAEKKAKTGRYIAGGLVVVSIIVLASGSNDLAGLIFLGAVYTFWKHRSGAAVQADAREEEAKKKPEPAAQKPLLPRYGPPSEKIIVDDREVDVLSLVFRFVNENEASARPYPYPSAMLTRASFIGGDKLTLDQKDELARKYPALKGAIINWWYH